MTGETKRPMWQIGLIIVAILAGLFGLLVIGGWAMVIGLGLLCGYGYWKTSNKGLLTACGLWIGLGIGMGVEILLERTGGVPMLGGVGVGLIAVYGVERVRSASGQLWLAVIGVVCLAATTLLWEADEDTKSMYLLVFQYGLLMLLIVVGVQFWVERKRPAN
jgi:hypothetical protein